MRARLKNNLSETQLEHCVTTENLVHKHWMHEKAEQEIKYIWKIHYHLQDMFTIIKIKADNFFKFSEEFFNITKIVFDNKWKQFKIKKLKKTVKKVKKEENHLINVVKVKVIDAENCYQHTLEEKNDVIVMLEAWLCSENLSLQCHIRKGKGCGGRQVVDQVRSEDIESSEPFMSQWRDIMFWYLYLMKHWILCHVHYVVYAVIHKV